MDVGLFELVILGTALLAAVSIVMGTIRYGISPMPSSRKAQQAMLSLMPEQTQGVIYELGSGWGQLACKVAAQCPQAQVVGVEASLVPWLTSKLLGLAWRAKNARFRLGNFEKQNLRDGGLVLCYLYPGAMTQLAERFGNELRPGTVIITNTFRLPGWTPETTIELEDMHRTPVYRYIVPSGDNEGPIESAQP